MHISSSTNRVRPHHALGMNGVTGHVISRDEKKPNVVLVRWSDGRTMRVHVDNLLTEDGKQMERWREE